MIEKPGPAPVNPAGQVAAWRLDATRAVLRERERELLDIKGPCSTTTCRLHYAHAGPCATTPAETTEAGQ